MTASFFTYRLSRDITVNSDDTAVAINVSNSIPERSVSDKNLPPEQTNIKHISPSVGDVEDVFSLVPETVAAESSGSPQALFRYRQTNSLSLYDNQSSGGISNRTEYVAEQGKINTKLPELQYLPDEILPEKENRWSIAAMASPTYYSKFNSGDDEFSRQLMESEEPVVSYTGGVGLSYKISRRFSIQSGLYYSSLGQKLDGINTFGGFRQYDNSKGDNNFEIRTSTGTIYASNPDVFVNADVANRVVTPYTNDVFDPEKGKSSVYQ